MAPLDLYIINAEPVRDIGAVGEHVVLLDAAGRPRGTAPKATVHDRRTPLHLAFSCHVVRSDGALLLTQRALTKATWPGVWSNACCGHPQVDEGLADAVCRRLRQELGVGLRRMTIEVPDFAYRAEMPGGVVEHELCPVVVAEVEGPLNPDPGEVADVRWVSWEELGHRAATAPGSLSPWSVLQIDELAAAGFSPLGWLRADVRCGTRAARHPGRSSAEPAVDPHGPVAEPVMRLLRGHLRATTSSLVSIDARLHDVASQIEALVEAGGKRLRPAFVYWGFRATGSGHDDRVFPAAAAVELLHTFALLHDDVMDRSEHRRGRPTAHRALAERHLVEGWHGDASWFGVSAAVLAGDLAFVGADELFDTIDVPPDAVRRARQVFGELRREVMAGQYLDLLLAADGTSSEHAARRVAVLKSARYTVTRPLLLGSALADEEAANGVESGAHHVRRFRRPRVPAARRRARPLRRPGDDGQERARRRAGGQAHPVDAPGAASRPRRRSCGAATIAWAIPTSERSGRRRSGRSSPAPVPWHPSRR